MTLFESTDIPTVDKIGITNRDRYFASRLDGRNYKYHKCILCDQIMTYNQYRDSRKPAKHCMIIHNTCKAIALSAKRCKRKNYINPIITIAKHRGVEIRQ